LTGIKPFMNTMKTVMYKPERTRLTLSPSRRHGCLCTEETMPVETQFLRLRQPVELGDRIDGWRVCWLGGWDRHRIFYIVMVQRGRS
jgi:hypothetical protein